MIQKTLSLVFLLTFLISPVFSQDIVGCDGARYRYLVFEDFEKIEDVVYGSNIAANGSQEELEMDIYMPYGDSLTNRPVIIQAPMQGKIATYLALQKQRSDHHP